MGKCPARVLKRSGSQGIENDELFPKEPTGCPCLVNKRTKFFRLIVKIFFVLNKALTKILRPRQLRSDKN